MQTVSLKNCEDVNWCKLRIISTQLEICPCCWATRSDTILSRILYITRVLCDTSDRKDPPRGIAVTRSLYAASLTKSYSILFNF